jgi:glycine C-acetyltransferase
MAYTKLKDELLNELQDIREAGLYKDERHIEGAQGAEIYVRGEKVLNFCANNYLGLSNDSEIVEAAKAGLDKWGYGLSSVRFMCGTQKIHKQLEDAISKFMQTDDTIMYSSCFDANTGFFETFFGKEDAIISDQLNHASIIDGVRLSKAMRFRYKNADMDDLKSQLEEAQKKGAKRIVIYTDGIFSMDGIVAPIKEICDLAEEYDALVFVDDSHATGFFGPNGRGSVEHADALGRVDIITSTLGKAMGGASGGFTTGRKEIIEYLRQKSRPYLFSNTLAPAIVSASLKVLELLEATSDARDKLMTNTKRFRKEMTELGFDIVEGTEGVHPICPVMLGDAKVAKDMADRLLKEGIYVIGFSYPVVPKDHARIRVQMSAAHTAEQLTKCIKAFEKIGKEMNVI